MELEASGKIDPSKFDRSSRSGSPASANKAKKQAVIELGASDLGIVGVEPVTISGNQLGGINQNGSGENPQD